MSRAGQTVYFMRQAGVDRGPVKIGCSHYLACRLDSLSVWSPVPLEVAASFGGDFSDERRLHSAFWSQHMHHEWFQWSPRLQAVIDAVREGVFSVEALPPTQKINRNGRRVARGWTDAQRLRATASAIARKHKGKFLTPAAMAEMERIIALKDDLETRRSLVRNAIDKSELWVSWNERARLWDAAA